MWDSLNDCNFRHKDAPVTPGIVIRLAQFLALCSQFALNFLGSLFNKSNRCVFIYTQTERRALNIYWKILLHF
jgi:hypothetical protein